MKIFGRRPGAAVDAEIVVNVHQMGADRGVADVEARDDFLVGEAFRQPGGNFQFTRRQLYFRNLSAAN